MRRMLARINGSEFSCVMDAGWMLQRLVETVEGWKFCTCCLPDALSLCHITWRLGGAAKLGRMNIRIASLFRSSHPQICLCCLLPPSQIPHVNCGNKLLPDLGDRCSETISKKQQIGDVGPLRLRLARLDSALPVAQPLLGAA